MHRKVFFILALMVTVILAPVVDSLACDDCKDILPLRDMRQSMTSGGAHADGELSSDAGSHAPRETGTAQDLCPVCANTAAAIDNVYCGAPSLLSQRAQFSKLLALSDPSYSINKPPQI